MTTFLVSSSAIWLFCVTECLFNCTEVGTPEVLWKQWRIHFRTILYLGRCLKMSFNSCIAIMEKGISRKILLMQSYVLLKTQEENAAAKIWHSLGVRSLKREELKHHWVLTAIKGNTRFTKRHLKAKAFRVFHSEKVCFHWYYCNHNSVSTGAQKGRTLLLSPRASESVSRPSQKHIHTLKLSECLPPTLRPSFPS